MADIKDFTRNRQAPQFRIRDRMFFGVYALGAEKGLRLAARFSAMNESTPPQEQIQALRDTLQELLQPDSYDRFAALMAADDDPDVISVDQLDAIVTWLFEEYGLRPTQPSESSASGRSNPATGTPSTDGAPQEASIPSTFLSTAS